MTERKFVPCPICDHNISDRAEYCPHCGVPFERSGFLFYWGLIMDFVPIALVFLLIWFIYDEISEVKSMLQTLLAAEPKCSSDSN